MAKACSMHGIDQKFIKKILVQKRQVNMQLGIFVARERNGS